MNCMGRDEPSGGQIEEDWMEPGYRDMERDEMKGHKKGRNLHIIFREETIQL